MAAADRFAPYGRGAVYRDEAVAYGDRVLVDDDFVLCFTKRL